MVRLSWKSAKADFSVKWVGDEKIVERQVWIVFVSCYT